jgi:hypothetical protein
MMDFSCILQHLAQWLTRSVEHWRPEGVATNSGFPRSESAERVNGYENRCKSKSTVRFLGRTSTRILVGLIGMLLMGYGLIKGFKIGY